MPKETIDTIIQSRINKFENIPFLSAYLFSFIFWNSKLILIYFSTKLTLNEKVSELKWDDVNYLTPLFIATGIALAYPIIKLGSSFLNLAYIWANNHLKIFMYGEIPATKEDIDDYEDKINSLKKDLDDVNMEKFNIREEYKKEDSLLRTKHKLELENQENLNNEEIEKITNDLQQEFEQTMNTQLEQIKIEQKKIIDDQVEKRINEFHKNIEELKNDAEKGEVEKGDAEKGDAENKELINKIKLYKSYRHLTSENKGKINDLSISNIHISLLELFNKYDTTILISDIKRLLKEAYIANPPKTQSCINDLTKWNIVSYHVPSGKVSLTPLGLELIEDIL